jgi:hypothetical protein
MNRYAALGISKDAEQGKRVIVITVLGIESRCALDEIAAQATADITVRRANGREQIDYPNGGRVTVRTHRQHLGLRGHNADVLYLDVGVDALIHDTAVWDSLWACTATSPHRELIRA